MDSYSKTRIRIFVCGVLIFCLMLIADSVFQLGVMDMFVAWLGRNVGIFAYLSFLAYVAYFVIDTVRFFLDPMEYIKRIRLSAKAWLCLIFIVGFSVCLILSWKTDGLVNGVSYLLSPPAFVQPTRYAYTAAPQSVVKPTRYAYTYSGPSATPHTTTTPVTIKACVAVNDRVNVREGPGTGYKFVTSLSTNDCPTVVGRNRDVSWVKIKEGWVRADLLKQDTPFTLLPVADGTRATVKASAMPFRITSSGPVSKLPTLDVSSSKIKRLFENFEYDFENGVAQQGLIRVMGTSPTRTAFFSLDSSNDRVTGGSFWMKPGKDSQDTVQNLKDMEMFLNALLPDWSGSNTWMNLAVDEIANALNKGATSHDVVTSYKNAEITLVCIDGEKIIVLVIKAK